VELVQRLTSTRRGTVALAALAALLAGASILVYLNRYRHSLNVQGVPATVLIAKATIPKGTPGAAVAQNAMFTTTTIRQSQLLVGAISDPVSLRGRVAAHDIFPGQQLTAADFVTGGASDASTLTKAERLITLPLDAAHGLIGQAQAGDHVDVFAGFNVVRVDSNGVPLSGGQSRPVMKLIMQDVPVVSVNKSGSGIGSGSSNGSLSLRVTDVQAEQLAFASDNGKLWVVLRPPTGAKPVRPNLVTIETMLLGIPSVVIQRSFGGR
jgi:Flp pilus assembly protein CpaB